MSDRNYIPLREKLAAALSLMLAKEHRDELRCRRVSADDILAMFHFHHIIYDVWGGSGAWWNLEPMPKAAHVLRTRKIDVPAIAKAKRIIAREHEFRRLMLLSAPERKEEKRKYSRWPRREKLP